MTSLDGFIHLLSFVAPAFAVALLVAVAGGWLVPRQSQSRSWWMQAAINFAAGLVALGAGLWYFGVDGKMASYAALILAVASSQWICARAWRA